VNPDEAAFELGEELDRLRRDIASALARWPNHPDLLQLEAEVAGEAEA
jgi:hypothetical protein